MSQAPYSWVFTGNCPSCGSPIYGRVTKGMAPTGEPFAGVEDWGRDQPEARRTCPASCPHGKLVST